jgi:cell shape-determining protein MreC
MVTIIALILINLTLFALSISIGNYRFSVLLSVFSIFAAVGNFLAILLPNLKNCKQLSYNNPFLEEKIEQINQSPQKLIMIQSQNEKPLEEEAYPEVDEVVKEPINKPITPNYIEQTQGYDDDNSNRSSIGAPAPAFI